MSAKLSFDLVSPERLLFSGAVDMVTLPGAEGDFGVLAAHAPVIALLRPGVIDIATSGQAARRIYVRGGFAEVSAKGLTVLAEQAIPVDEIKRADIEQRLTTARGDLADAKTDQARKSAQEAIDQLTDLLALAA